MYHADALLRVGAGMVGEGWSTAVAEAAHARRPRLVLCGAVLLGQPELAHGGELAAADDAGLDDLLA